jgi:multidrug efflux pump
VSLTLTPMMAGRMLKGELQHEREDFLTRVIARYTVWLDWVLDRQRPTLLVMLATLVLTAGLYMVVPKGFFPSQDSGVLQVVTEAPQDISFAAMAERQQALAEKILEDPAVASLSSFIGVDGTNTTLNSGRMLVNLKPHEERADRAQAIIERLRTKLSDPATGVTGIRAYLQPVQELSIEDRVSRTQYQMTLTSPDMEELALWTNRLLERLQQVPALSDVASDLQNQGLQAYVEIHRDQAARLGVSVAQIANALYSAFGQRQIATLFTQANQYRVVLEVDPSRGDGLAALETTYVPTRTGGPVPLSTVATVTQRPTPLLVNHQGQFPASTISFNLAPGASLGEAVEAIEAAQREIGLPLSVEARFQGAAEAFRSSLSNTLWLILAAVVTMYIVLGVLYESFIHPVTILSTLPSATVGALLALLVTREPLDLIAVIGIVLLIGLVKKNGIMMVDFALEAQRAGATPREAIRRAAQLRFRPILMTTLAALVGALPLMLASGSGAELRAPLGIVMVGGLLVSQVLTIFTTPVVYLFFDRLGTRRAADATVAAAPATESGGAA